MLAQYGFKRYPELPDVPAMLELAKSEADRQAMTMLFARTEYGRPYFLPPDVPAARVDGAAARLRRHHEGPGLRRRCGKAPVRGRSAHRRAGAGAGRRNSRRRRARSSRACAPRWRRRGAVIRPYRLANSASLGLLQSSLMAPLVLEHLGPALGLAADEGANSAGVLLLTARMPAFSSLAIMPGSA